MKKVIISIILCISCFFGVGCSLTLTNESLEESLIESIEQEEVSPDYTEIQYVYTPLDENVLADIEAYLGHKFGYDCYYGEFEGKHVFYTAMPIGGNSAICVGPFQIWGYGGPILIIWDGRELVNSANISNQIDIFSFETSKEIAFVHDNHYINRCCNRDGKCYFKDGTATKKSWYGSRWDFLSGKYGHIWVHTGEYEMKGYCAEESPILSGNMGIQVSNLGILPGEFKETKRFSITVENVVGFEEKFSCYGTVADVLDMYQITEDMWLDSYEGASQSEGFDLEKAKSIKYCVPIHLSSPIEGCAEICLVVDNDKDKNTYILIMSVDEETGKKYISQIYHYQKVEDEE